MPRWRRDGKELFYFGVDGRLMATTVALGPSFESRTPTALFKVSLPSPDRQYDVISNGSRILVNRISGEAEGAPITVVLDWAAGLEPK